MKRLLLVSLLTIGCAEEKEPQSFAGYYELQEEWTGEGTCPVDEGNVVQSWFSIDADNAVIVAEHDHGRAIEASDGSIVVLVDELYTSKSYQLFLDPPFVTGEGTTRIVAGDRSPYCISSFLVTGLFSATTPSGDL